VLRDPKDSDGFLWSRRTGPADRPEAEKRAEIKILAVFSYAVTCESYIFFHFPLKTGGTDGDKNRTISILNGVRHRCAHDSKKILKLLYTMKRDWERRHCDEETEEVEIYSKEGSVLIGFCIFCLLAAALAGCGGKSMKGSKYLGKWNAVSAEMSGMEFSVSDFMDEFSIILKGGWDLRGAY
jgi:hypothetical protein